MWAAGLWGAASPASDARSSAGCRSRSRPSSGPFSDLMAGAPGQGPETVTVCSPSPPLSCSNSTMSLLSPLGHQSFPFDYDDGDGEDEEDVEEDAQDSEAKVANLRGVELQGCVSGVVGSEDNQEQKQVCLPESHLTPWEVWFVGKEKEERDRLQQKALEELNQQLEKRKEMEEREKRKAIAEEKHKEWVQKKNEQKKKEREQKINKEMEEKAAKEMEKEHLQEKAKEKYQEWLKKKNAEECEKKKKEKEKEKQRQAELQEKKEIAEKKFKEWLENAKNKPRPAAKGYGYANGKLTGRSTARRVTPTQNRWAFGLALVGNGAACFSLCLMLEAQALLTAAFTCLSDLLLKNTPILFCSHNRTYSRLCFDHLGEVCVDISLQSKWVASV
ncbi:coiled-coil domain-containing protein 34 isoform X1 [Panthera uncia]|uniref:coiled-coil domain-containing protein 34 isoform X1 n=1 Tax=Panthera uncia TaxID=29064 RepID=UPI0020FFCB71|nr:coiled-coil domain-containing protein 34 isoform X1 [Panthera uncia]